MQPRGLRTSRGAAASFPMILTYTLIFCYFLNVLDAMITPDMLKAVQLKHTTMPTKKPSLQSSSGPGQSEFEHSFRQSRVEKWVEVLSEFTFKTLVVPLPISEAERLIHAHAVYESTRTIDDARIQQLMKEFLNVMQSGIEQTIRKISRNQYLYGAFVRLSSRSPKDASIHFPEDLRKHYERSLKAMSSSSRRIDDNSRTLALLQASTDIMRFQNAHEVVKALVVSDRVDEDLKLALKYPSDWTEHLVIREWEPIQVDLEFRAFVSHGKLTALSQYNFAVYSQTINDHADEIQTLIVNFFHTKVQQRMRKAGYDSYIIDFALVPAEGTMFQVKIIEINAFSETTDAAMFSWHKERHLLTHGPLEFRYTREPRANVADLFSKPYQAFLHDMKQREANDDQE